MTDLEGQKAICALIDEPHGEREENRLVTSCKYCGREWTDYDRVIQAHYQSWLARQMAERHANEALKTRGLLGTSYALSMVQAAGSR